MTYEDKISHAHKVIAAGLGMAKSPCIMCSFGKDSIVLLHMVMQQKKLKVVFHREPFQHHKYEYASRIIRDWDLHTLDYPPSQTAVQEKGNEFYVINHYQAGNNYIFLPTGLRQDSRPGALCALDEIYHKPTGSFNYPFDVAFVGHKSCDVDPVNGAVPLNSDFAKNVGAVTTCYPLREFTDADIWRYIEDNKLPIHHERYEKVNGEWRGREDKTFSPDYIDACYACMSGTTGPSVACPKVGFRVSSVSDQLRWVKMPELNYLKETK